MNSLPSRPKKRKKEKEKGKKSRRREKKGKYLWENAKTVLQVSVIQDIVPVNSDHVESILRIKYLDGKDTFLGNNAS